MKNRIMSKVLAVMLIVTMMMPAAVFADDTAAQINEINVSYEDTVSDATKTLKAYYSDEYFNVNSSTYNNHMASLSMAMSMAAGTYGDSGIRALLAELGCRGIMTSGYGTSGSNTIGVAVASKQLENGDCVVPIAIRGSNYKHEWSRNLETGKTGDALGYAEPAKQVVAKVNDYVANLKAGGVKNVYLWIMGYSRAGSVADIAARTLTDKYGMDNVYAYIIEGPAAAAKATTNKNYTNIHNILNEYSGIKVVMPAYMGFSQYGPLDKTLGTGNETVMKSMLNKINNSINYSSPAGFQWYKMQLKVDFNKSTWKSEIIDIAFGGKDIVSTTAGAKDSQANFWPQLISRLKKVFPSRKAYTTTVSAKTKAAAKALSVKACTSEQAAMIAADMIMNHELELDSFTNINTGTLIGYSVGILPILATTVGSIQKGKLPSLSNKEYTQIVQCLYDIIESTGSYSSTQKDNIKKVLAAGTESILKFLAYDYGADKQVLGTLLKNSDRLIQPHYPEINMAWLMSEDSYYNSAATDTIGDAPAAIKKLSGVSAASKGFTAKWKKVSDIDGYQIAYSTKSNMSNPTINTIAPSKTKLKITKLSKKKTYYVKIRTYKNVNGVKNYSAWSTSKKIKTK